MNEQQGAALAKLRIAAACVLEHAARIEKDVVAGLMPNRHEHDDLEDDLEEMTEVIKRVGEVFAWHDGEVDAPTSLP